MAGEILNLPAGMRLHDLNDTELRSLLRKQGFAVPVLATREFLEAAWNESVKPGPMTLIDWYRWAMMAWVNQNWDTVYYQIECSMIDEGCMSCPDFQVASCLVANRHIFDLTKEEVEMPGVNWPVLILTLGSKREEAAKLLLAAAEMNLEDTKSNRFALKKTTKAVFDLLNNGSVKVTDYMGLLEKDIPEEVILFATNGSIPEVLKKLAAYLNGEVNDGEVKDEPVQGQATEAPAAAPHPAEANTAAPAKDLPPKDEEKKAEVKATETKGKLGYFPGVSDQRPDSLPSEDSLEEHGSTAGASTGDEPLPDRFDGAGSSATSARPEPLPAGQSAELFLKKNGDTLGKGPLQGAWTENEIRIVVRDEFVRMFNITASLLAEYMRVLGKPVETPTQEPPKTEAPKAEPPKTEPPKTDGKPKGKRGGLPILPPTD